MSLDNRQRQKKARESIVLWKKPLTALSYFFCELFLNICEYGQQLLKFRCTLICCSVMCIALYSLTKIPGPHEMVVCSLEKKLFWCLYWIGLGVLSSVGLGTGLHTFLLYLGPHIAAVTLAAYECGSLNFPEPPYPDEIICPDEADPAWKVNTWSIMAKVRLETFMWGMGTALGELPPYFMARAARLSGYDPDDEDDLQAFEELHQKHPNEMTFAERAKLAVEKFIKSVGFLGILACASIPNPLFDLAGITCGHFLVPFWTFFGATFIGKAIIKMHIQKVFIIIAFNEALLAKAVSMVIYLPVIGSKLQEPFKEYLVEQKSKLHNKGGSKALSEGSVLSSVFEKFVFAMILYFVVSMINSLAQSYHKRINKRPREEKIAKD